MYRIQENKKETEKAGMSGEVNTEMYGEFNK